MIRLILASLLFLLSLLVVFKAGTHFLWLVAVAVTSYAFIGVLLSLTSLVAGCWSTKYKVLVLCLSAISMVLYSLPILSASSKSKSLVDDMNKAFVTEQHSQTPFSFSTMLFGKKIKEVVPQSIVYKALPSKELSLNFYPSNSHTISPTVIVVHGGSWESGDNKQLPELNSYLANKGYNIAAINYRLAPAYQSPAPIEDTKDALLYILQHATQLKIDTNNIVLLGRSAGVQIALCAAYSMNNNTIKGAIDFYGPADMVWGGQVKANSWVLDVNKIYKDYFGGSYNEVPNKFKEASAVDYVNEHSVPTLIIHGSNDAMVSIVHSEHLSERLKQHKVPYYFLQLPFATHGCDFNLNSPDAQLTTYAVEHFLNSVTKHSWNSWKD